MKWMIASDIHGSEKFLNKLIGRMEAEKPERIMLLGDLLYHGPRNDLPEGYAPKKVIDILNSIREKLFCVRGNCEAEVDQMVLKFPVLAEYALIEANGRMIYATHGHHAGETNPPPFKNEDILLCGHTHVPKCTEHEGFVYMNPGSVSIPKDGSARSYMMMENGLFEWKKLEDGSVYMEYRI